MKEQLCMLAGFAHFSEESLGKGETKCSAVLKTLLLIKSNRQSRDVFEADICGTEFFSLCRAQHLSAHSLPRGCLLLSTKKERSSLLCSLRQIVKGWEGAECSQDCLYHRDRLSACKIWELRRFSSEACTDWTRAVILLSMTWQHVPYLDGKMWNINETCNSCWHKMLKPMVLSWRLVSLVEKCQTTFRTSGISSANLYSPH